MERARLNEIGKPVASLVFNQSINQLGLFVLKIQVITFQNSINYLWKYSILITCTYIKKYSTMTRQNDHSVIEVNYHLSVSQQVSKFCYMEVQYVLK